MKIVRNAFPQAPANLRRGLQSGMERGGQAIFADMQNRTPVATGALRESERIEVHDGQMRLYAGAPYALFVHQGTHRMGPRPFMTGALQSGQSGLYQAMADDASAALG